MNALGLLPVPLGVVTDTLCGPLVPAGVTAVICVSLTTTTLVASPVPTFTLVAPRKLVPVMVMAVPPTLGPVVGLIDVIVGANAM